MLLLLEHHREGSDNGLNPRKSSLEYSVLCYEAHVAQKMKVILNIPQYSNIAPDLNALRKQ